MYLLAASSADAFPCVECAAKNCNVNLLLLLFLCYNFVGACVPTLF